jgi:hypothetical protein
MTAKEPRLLRGLRQEGVVMQLKLLLLLQMVQVSFTAINAVVVRTWVESAVSLGARGVARLSRGQAPVCGGRSAAGITSRRHVWGRKTTGTRKSKVSEERVPRAKRSNSWGGNAILGPSNVLIMPKKAETRRYARRRPREPPPKRVFWML